MSERKRSPWPSIVGFGLPVAFLAIVLVAFLARGAGEKPGHDFLVVSSGYPYGDDYSYAVADGHLARRVNQQALLEWQGQVQVARKPDPTRAPQIYRYVVSSDSVKLVSYEDAAKLSLDAGPTSDDGFTVGLTDYGGEGIFSLMGGSGPNPTLPIYRDGALVGRLPLPSSLAQYGQPSFLAWIQ